MRVRSNASLILGVFFTTIGAAAIIHIWMLTERFNNEHHLLQQQIICQNELIDVLQTRSDARIRNDLAAQEYLQSLTVLLEDMKQTALKRPLAVNEVPTVNIEHIDSALQDARKAEETRSNPDLWTPYPRCHHNTRSAP